MRFPKIFLASFLVVLAATIALAASNKRKKEPKCDCNEVEECTGHTYPSADGPSGVADCEGFTFSISNLVGVVEQMQKVNRWTGDDECPEDEIIDEWKLSGGEPTVEWIISSGGQSASGSGSEAHIAAGDSDSANCTFTVKSNAPHCGEEFTATLSASAQFTNNVTVSGGDICCTSSSHTNHMFTWAIDCGNAKNVSANGANIVSQGANNAVLQGSGPTMNASLTVAARGGTGTVGFKVFDVGDLELTGGCGCFPDCSETMEGFDVSGIQHLQPSGEGSVKKEGTTITGWFDCNCNGIPDADEPHKTRSYTIVKRPSLRIASDNDAGGTKNEGFAPGTKLIFEVDGNACGTPQIEIVSMEAKEKGTSMKAGEIVSNGNSCEMTIPPDCPAGTITFEVTFSRHRCISEQTTITVAGCSCSTCEQSGDMSCENGCIDISFGLGRTETGGAKSRIHIRLDDTSIMPEIASRTFPDGRLESFVTNGVRHLEFYDTTKGTPHVSYELTPGESAFTVLEKRNGTPRRFTRWTKSGDEWIMEIYDPTVSPMELVERVAKTETSIPSGRIVRETNGIVSIEQEYRSLSNGDMFLVRETRGTGANAQTTWHAPVESGDGAGQTRSTVNPDGSWIIYTYDSEGRVLTEIEPFGDTAPILDASHAVTGYNGAARVTEYMYSSVDNRDDGTLSQFTPRTTITRIGSDSLGWTETSRRYHVEFLETDSNNTTRRVAITERTATPGAAYGASDSLRTTTYYNWRNANAGRPNLRIAEDGLATFYCYEFAVTNTAAGIVKNRVTESFTAPLSATNGIPCKTTVSRTVANLKGDVSREETWLVVEEDRELLSWTDYERDSAGRILRSESSNGDIYEAQWGCCGEDWTLDERGILTDYSYDAAKRRISSSCGTVTTLWSYDLSGNATNVTRYGISGTSPALVASSSSGFDDAGRLAWTIGEDGIRTEYIYGVSSEGGEIRTTIRAVGTDCAVTNTVVSYRDGNTKATYLNGILKETNINEPFSSITYEGTNGVSSARWTQSQTDFLGRTVSQSRPGFGGSTLVTSNLYDSVGRLCATSVSSTIPNPSSSNLCVSAPLRETIYLYNELGERVATIDDCDFDSAIDWSGPDVISSNATCYVCIDGDWWRESRSYAIQEDNSSEARLMGVGRTRMTGLGEDGLASESVSIDQRGNATTNRVWRYRDDAMEMTETKYPTSQIAALSVVSNNLAIMSVSQTGVTNTLSYDALNRQISQTDGRGNTTQTIYDEHGRVASIIDALGYATTYGYDALGRQISVTDPLTNTVTTVYDAEGRVIAQRGATYPVDYAYNEFGEKIAMTTYRDLNSSGDTTLWMLDEATGLVTNKVYADGIGPTYTYTPDGKLATRTWARGIITTYSYDANGSLTNTVYSDGTPTISLTYNRAGRQVCAEDAAGITTFIYDEFGSLTNETAVGIAGTNTIERYYDFSGRSTGYALNGARLSTLAYDSAGRLASVFNPTAATEYQYSTDGFDMGCSTTISNGVGFTRGIARDGYRRSLVTNIVNSAAGTVVETFDYAYDALGRPVSRNADTFGYNDHSEVTSVTISEGLQSPATAYYGYDEIGNSTNWAANCLNQYAEFTHDVDGNMTQCDDWTYTYDAGNRLKTVSSNYVPPITNFYDAKSRRVKKVTAEATIVFFYDDWNLIKEHIAYTNDTTSTVRYYWGKDLSGTLQGAGGVGGLLYLTVDGAIYIPCYDANGNITRYLDSTGNTVATYTYDTFGNIIVQSGSLADFFRHRFSTKYYDIETGLCYYGYRFYHPVLMRWLTRDPIEEEGGENLYCFCLNNTISKYDAFGHDVTLTTGNRNASRWQVGNRFYHQEICVDTWFWNPKSCCWRKSGRSCYSFAATGFGFGRQGSSWLGMNSIKGPGILRGAVYPTDDQGLEDTETLETTPCQDRAFLDYLQSMDGREDTYSLGRHSCRTFSQAMMEEAKRRKNSGGCKNDKKCE